MNKLLIANRGEIACRIIKSCNMLGISTVAVYSDADALSAHVEMADEAINIGAAAARSSYLDVNAILGVIKKTGANIVHPGYGFLAENAQFAKQIIAAGCKWVGPDPDVIIAMGDKEQARKIAARAGVPILPGSKRFAPNQLENIYQVAHEVGFPLLVKAAAGGGGIGMRLVNSPSELQKVVETTQELALSAFGNGDIYLERYISNARHIEVQVFGFGDGEGVHLYDRECSVQRRFQKVLEEAPVLDIPDHIRQSMYETALNLVKVQRYQNAGTVEFVYDANRQEFYFLEMNTRIQVEHPVTEYITGVDLIRWQIKLALGDLEHISQADIKSSGHAIECRIYAERPEKKFLPAPGTISELVWPAQDNNIRIDTGIRLGDSITPYYDPLIAKLIAYGDDRSQAIEHLKKALSEVLIIGPGTNVKFLQALISDQKFIDRENISTTFLDRFVKRWKVS